MPGPWFSWAKSLSFKAKSLSFKSDSSSDTSEEARTGSFSSAPLRTEKSKSPRRSGCTQGCSPSISNLKDVSSRLLSSKASTQSSSCSSPTKSDYIHQTNNGEYFYRAPLKLKESKSFLKQYSFNKPQEGSKSKEAGGSGNLTKENLCLVKGCCECSMYFDTVDGVLVPRDPHNHGSLSPKWLCSKCGEAFYKPEALELHQVVRHAVSELGSGNSSLNVVEIIFKTSWLTKGTPCPRIVRVLKIDNTDKTISEFHSYRDTVIRAASDEGKKHERCLADGNELLRFYGTSFTCTLGTNGSSNLCTMTTCKVCNIIRWGFAARKQNGIYTTATSGKAHEAITTGEKENWRGYHAMLLCRVIAGRVHKSTENCSRFTDASCLPAGYDSISPGSTANLDELTVFNPKAVLPCFVVVYTL